MPKKNTTRRITKTMQAEFVRKLKSAANSRAVETEVIAPAYRDVVEAFFNGNWTFDHSTDGFFTDSGQVFASIRLLLEAKYDLDLRAAIGRSTIVAQCVYYMKRFEESGHDQPTVIFGADKDQMFVVYAPPLRKYLEKNYDWTLAPSSAASRNPDLMAALNEDRLLATFVYDIKDKSFDLNDVMMAVDKLSENDGEYDRIEITPQNVRAVFDSFLLMTNIHKTKMSNEDAVTLFITSLIGGFEAPQVDSSRRNTIYLTSGKALAIDTIAYKAFFSRYETVYNDQQVADLMSMYDVLLEEVARRFSGDFWTPTIWADKAHELLDHQLGADWREQFVVWDASCGTKNLTRDYTTFPNLYLSTLHQHELVTSTRYNQEAQGTFQYDFLNDDINIGLNALFGDEWKMPPALYRSLVEGKPLLFLMNPPYASAANSDETDKAGVASNLVRAAMAADGGYGAATGQLYTQFLYRIQKLKRDFKLPRVVVAVFTNDRFMTGGSYKKFTDRLQEDFGYVSGFFFNAAEFSDVKPNWGISFTMWDTEPGVTVKDEFKLDVVQVAESGIRSIGHRTVHNVSPEQSISTWLKQSEPHRPVRVAEGTYVRLAGPLEIHAAKSIRAHKVQGAIGYLHNNADSIEHSSKYVGMYSAPFGSGNGRPVTEYNFERACMVLAVRKSCIPAPEDMWITGHDDFTAPSIEPSPAFVADAVVYALFSRNGSYQSSMRDVSYQGKTLTVMNELFFMSSESIKKLATAAGDRKVLMDIKNFGSSERYAYTWLSGNSASLTPAAKGLKDAAVKILVNTFPDRAAADPALHLNAWDAGFAQIYRHAAKVHPDLVKEYSAAHERLRLQIADEAVSHGFIGSGTAYIAS